MTGRIRRHKHNFTTQIVGFEEVLRRLPAKHTKYRLRYVVETFRPFKV